MTGAGYGFGIYIHWPYCTRICPYCDFNVYAAKARDTGPLVDAICADLAYHSETYGAKHRLSSIYFGGGTPSLIGAGGLSRILETIHRLFGPPRWETTLEANPLDITPAALTDWNRLGITRLSSASSPCAMRHSAFWGGTTPPMRPGARLAWRWRRFPTPAWT